MKNHQVRKKRASDGGGLETMHSPAQLTTCPQHKALVEQTNQLSNTAGISPAASQASRRRTLDEMQRLNYCNNINEEPSPQTNKEYCTNSNSHTTLCTEATSSQDLQSSNSSPSLNHDSGLIQAARSLWEKLGHETQGADKSEKPKSPSRPLRSSLRPEKSISLYPSLPPADEQGRKPSATTKALESFLKKEEEKKARRRPVIAKEKELDATSLPAYLSDNHYRRHHNTSSEKLHHSSASAFPNTSEAVLKSPTIFELFEIRRKERQQPAPMPSKLEAIAPREYQMAITIDAASKNSLPEKQNDVSPKNQ